MTPDPSVNISKIVALSPPEKVLAKFPSTPSIKRHVEQARLTISNIINKQDERLLIIVGPCSIHCGDVARDYAAKLKKVADQVSDSIYVVMRTYFEKPRTSLGWKGLVYDPELNGTHDIERGLAIAREILVDLNKINMPCATEWLDPVTPQYLGDLIAWGAIGARSVEGQIHRQMASGLSAPVGFKNSTGGNIQVAVLAAMTARVSQTFLGITASGQAGAVSTNGNPTTHIVLRGGQSGPNYESKYVAEAAELMVAENMQPAILVDCSHGNSGKDHTRQPGIFRNILQQFMDNPRDLIGMMLESNIKAGKQRFNGDRDQLLYGVSITDSCIDWPTTENLILEAHETLKKAGK